jgi:hypothetical protein
MQKHYAEFARALDDGDFTETDGGILIKSGGPMARGRYFTKIGGEIVTLGTNKVPLEGLKYFMNTGVKGGTAQTAFYMALFSAATNPLDSWTAANFTANATEIVSPTEGYSNATRPAWTPGDIAVSAAKVDNLAALATYNIVCTTSINISGAAILTSNVKGGTGGILISASRFDSPHTVNNGSTFELGYELELQDI